MFVSGCDWCVNVLLCAITQLQQEEDLGVVVCTSSSGLTLRRLRVWMCDPLVRLKTLAALVDVCSGKLCILLLLGRLPRVDLITWVEKCPSIRPSSTKSFIDFNEIWYVGSGRRVMHDGMQYDPIQGQGQGHDHDSLKGGNSAIFKDSSPIYNDGWQMTTDS